MSAKNMKPPENVKKIFRVAICCQNLDSFFTTLPVLMFWDVRWKLDPEKIILEDLNILKSWL